MRIYEPLRRDGAKWCRTGLSGWSKVCRNRWGFPKIRGTILGVPILRIIVFGGLYWGPLILGNYQIQLLKGWGGVVVSFSSELRNSEAG